MGNRTILEGTVALLDYRMENGSGSTGWSRAWAAILGARMSQGDTALKCRMGEISWLTGSRMTGLLPLRLARVYEVTF
jgi:hypothetical protein